MNFDLTAPCSNCPFLREGGVRLRIQRAADIASYAIEDGHGKTFACHKTTGAAGKRRREHSQCAGALVFAQKHDWPTALFQIAYRLGRFDPEKLVGHDRVFDTVEELLKVQLP